jgi:hypothetical protein
MRISKGRRKRGLPRKPWPQIVADAVDADRNIQLTVATETREVADRTLDERHVYYGLRRVAAQIGHTPGPREYDAARSKMLADDERLRRGGLLALVMPTSGLILRIVGDAGWDVACTIAQLDAVQHLPARSGNAPLPLYVHFYDKQRREPANYEELRKYAARFEITIPAQKSVSWSTLREEFATERAARGLQTPATGPLEGEELSAAELDAIVTGPVQLRQGLLVRSRAHARCARRVPGAVRGEGEAPAGALQPGRDRQGVAVLHHHQPGRHETQHRHVPRDARSRPPARAQEEGRGRGGGVKIGPSKENALGIVGEIGSFVAVELLAVGLWGVRRFAEKDGPLMDVVGSPIAVVGPNEAGKTTFLRSLELLNDPGEIPAGDLTRGGDGDARVIAHYRLEEDDLQAIAHIHRVGTPRTLEVYKTTDGSRYANVRPTGEHDLEPRKKARAAVAALCKTRWAEAIARTEKAEGETLATDALDEIADLLSGDEILDTEDLERFATALGVLSVAPDLPASGHTAIKRLEECYELEAKGDPRDAIRDALFARRPRFLWFDESWRAIESQFNVHEPPSSAMVALFQLIGFDLAELRIAISRANEPRITELVEEANVGFHALFTERWSQSNVLATIDRNGDIVHVYVRNVGGRLIPIAERSAGMRQFIAILAFVESRAQGENVVLLVDEADNHLHYDAQADLVRIFSEQTVVEKVIYSTHSAGCLPADLGTGVRVIEPCGPAEKAPEDWEHSRIRNAFWTTNPGFSPLLLAMGASSFAFSALRRALIGEGISEVILLPTLFREATGEKRLDFQVAPGISNVRAEDIQELDASAARVVYIVNGDEGGGKHRDRLIEGGVATSRIVELGEGKAPLALEDLLRKDLYRDAVNRELAHFNVELADSDIPDIGRKKAVENWCKAKRIGKPSEREVAQHLLEHLRGLRREGEMGSLLDPSRVALVKRIHRKVSKLLEDVSA